MGRTYSLKIGKKRVRVDIMNGTKDYCNVIAGRPGSEYVITAVPRKNLKPITSIQQTEKGLD